MSLVRGKEYYLYGIKEHGFLYKLRYGDPEPHKTELFSIASNLDRSDIRGGIAISSDINTGEIVRFTVYGDWVISVNNSTILESIEQLYLSSKTVDEQIENLLYIAADLIVNDQSIVKTKLRKMPESATKVKVFAKKDIEISYCGLDETFKRNCWIEIKQGEITRTLSCYAFEKQTDDFTNPSLLLGALLEGFV